jgi:serine protease inhibitor
MSMVRAVLPLAVLALAACGKSISDLEPVRNFTSAEEQVAASNTGFGLGLLRQIHAAEVKPNVLISPLSASMALGMTMNGAVGPTLDAMRRTLGFDGLSEDQVNDAYHGLIGQLRARDSRVEFRLANSIWYRQGFAVKQPFLLAAQQAFDASVTPLDFDSPAAPRTISQWAEDRTGGRIRDLVEQIDPLDVMILINAVYFKAPWAHPFEPNATSQRPFRRADGTSVNVAMMSQDRSLPHLMTDDVHIAELPYASGAFSMVVMAPPTGTNLDAFIARLTPAQWDQWMTRLESGRIMLSMPKFRFEYDIGMRPALEALGMGITFRPREADFTRIADRDDLHISAVRQKAFIDVHELGTEAAAATSVTISVTSMPPELRFDRPFVFAIRERTSGTILFIGRVGDPGAL